MTNELVKRYRAALEAKQADLARALRKRNEITIEHSAEALEQTVWAAERELAVGALDRGSRLLREVREALQRLADGNYGMCEECGQCIKSKRLDAVPWTRYCVACQDELDRNSQQPLYERQSALAACESRRAGQEIRPALGFRSAVAACTASPARNWLPPAPSISQAGRYPPS